MKPKKRLLLAALAVILAFLASQGIAQGPPSSCEDACLQAYKAAVKACKGDPACQEGARKAAALCIAACP